MNTDAIVTEILQMDGCEIGHHVGGDILGRIADLVEALLGNGAARDAPAVPACLVTTNSPLGVASMIGKPISAMFGTLRQSSI